MRDFEDLLSSSYFTFKEDRTITLCSRCGGTGFYTTEELVDYHRNDYETTRHSCEHCKGDGRMVSIKRYIDVRLREDFKTVPFVDFTENPHDSYYKSVRVRLDKSNSYLNHKYPELKEHSYERYDKLVEQYELLENMKKTQTKD